MCGRHLDMHSEWHTRIISRHCVSPLLANETGPNNDPPKGSRAISDPWGAGLKTCAVKATGPASSRIHQLRAETGVNISQLLPRRGDKPAALAGTLNAPNAERPRKQLCLLRLCNVNQATQRLYSLPNGAKSER